ncbi:GNAT family N-acetyltransferase [Martelella alba]|uniref:GNAT family N-acetyltransferase n=1 Tax=Martelella alba TaxID=2590451 RepID=A0ABY2SHG0_9HYPH|nr:GNAT family N-acetyltransferase [Martelella alba]TKI04476.1 GNAT family N-acetyltransferase [Martelella alba]
MTDHSQTETLYINDIEPHSLVLNFLRFPPAGFEVGMSESGLPCFYTRFDLTTTMDTAARQRLLRWPGAGLLRRLLTMDAWFIGTTVNEYSIFPMDMSPQRLAEWILKKCAAEKKFTIIKDLPQDSPLLSPRDNQYSHQLIIECLQRGFIQVEGQALAYVPIDFTDLDGYLSRLSHSRRRNIRRKLRSRRDLRVEILHTGDARLCDTNRQQEMYRLYREVYDQSEIHFDLHSPEFFAGLLTDSESAGRIFCYWREGELIGFNLCYVQNDKLIDKYIGLHYPQALEYNLYVVSWFVNLEYALSQGLRFYVAGWTDPQVKADLGAQFTFTTHLAWISQPLLRRILIRFRHHFESDARWQREQRP